MKRSLLLQFSMYSKRKRADNITRNIVVMSISGRVIFIKNGERIDPLKLPEIVDEELKKRINEA